MLAWLKSVVRRNDQNARQALPRPAPKPNDIGKVSVPVREDKPAKAEAHPSPVVAPAPPAPPKTRQQILSASFSSDAKPEPFLGQGWSKPEKGFTWGMGEESTIKLGIRLAQVDHELELDLKPHIAGAALPQQRLKVLFAGTEIGSALLTGRGTFRCVIPGARIMPDGLATLQLYHPDFRPPAEVVKTSNDRRLLAVAVEALRIFAMV